MAAAAAVVLPLLLLRGRAKNLDVAVGTVAEKDSGMDDAGDGGLLFVDERREGEGAPAAAATATAAAALAVWDTLTWACQRAGCRSTAPNGGMFGGQRCQMAEVEDSKIRRTRPDAHGGKEKLQNK